MPIPLDAYPLAKSRQGALFQRNPVCALCFRVCNELCNTYGSIHFDLLRSMQAADSLCACLIEHAWEPPDIIQCSQWLEEHLDNEAEVMCACAALSLSLTAMTDAPEPLRALGQDFRCIVHGDANRIYNRLRDAVRRENTTISTKAYGSLPTILPQPTLKLPRHMKSQQNIQFNAPVFQGCTFQTTTTTNNYFGAPPAEKDCQPECSQEPSDVQPEPKSLFCRITERAYKEGKAEIVEAELRSASVSAPKLVKAIRTNEALSYLDTRNLPSTELYDMLDEHFGLPFKPRNFSKYRSAL